MWSGHCWIRSKDWVQPSNTGLAAFVGAGQGCIGMNAAPAAIACAGARTFRFVQAVVSPRARGLSVRLNLNPDGKCNFDCAYCDVNRARLRAAPEVPEVDTMMEELEEALDMIRAGHGAELAGCGGAPPEYLKVGHVALSGNGEPTLCPVFEEIVEGVMHLRAQGRHGFFKVALITNSSGLQERAVIRGLRLLTSQDEIWAKLDAGTEAWYRQVNRSEIPYAEIVQTLLRTAQSRPVTIQSLFPRLQGRSMPLAEQDAFATRIADLRREGARIQLVQVYSASRLAAGGRCGHATLSELSAIARRVRETAGVPAVVF